MRPRTRWSIRRASILRTYVRQRFCSLVRPDARYISLASGCGEIWQTRTVQVRVEETPWRFESSQPHSRRLNARRSRRGKSNKRWPVRSVRLGDLEAYRSSSIDCARLAGRFRATLYRWLSELRRPEASFRGPADVVRLPARPVLGRRLYLGAPTRRVQVADLTRREVLGHHRSMLRGNRGRDTSEQGESTLLPTALRGGLRVLEILAVSPAPAWCRQEARAEDLSAHWQQALVDSAPEALLRGLIHSDGCRFQNTGRGWSAPRYSFSTLSDDIKDIFCEACGQFGVHWTRAGRKTIYISRTADVLASTRPEP